MDTTKNVSINWSSTDVLEEIIQNIKKPLENILAVSKGEDSIGRDEIVFSSSKEISDIVEEMMVKAREKIIKNDVSRAPGNI